MLYRGQFKSNKNEDVVVLIQTENDSSTVVEFNESGGDIYFLNDNPVLITQESDIFDTIQCTECTINLLVKNYLGTQFFTGNARDIIVNVVKSNKLVFCGFLEPNIYSQPFNKYYDTLTLTATCPLATLQYYPYADILNEENYSEYKRTAKDKTVGEIVANILTSIISLDLVNGTANHVYYDGSIRLSSSSVLQSDIFTDVQLTELLFLGESFDDLYIEHDVLHEILQFFDLKIRCQGNSFYIYSLSTIYQRKTIDWYPLFTDIFYTIEQSSYVRQAKGIYREVLTSSSDNSQISGNILSSELSVESEQILVNKAPTWVKYYYVQTPDGTVKKTEDYELADIQNIYEYIEIDDASTGDETYYILDQDIYGNYTLDSSAPSQALDENGDIIYPQSTFDINETNFIITEN